MVYSFVFRSTKHIGFQRVGRVNMPILTVQIQSNGICIVKNVM